MTSKEFVIWMRGFMEACNEYTATPKQWDRIKEELEGVNDAFIETPGMFQVHPEKPYPGVPIGEGGWGTPNVAPGTTGILNIPNLNTSTTYVNPQSGSWHYTNS